MADEIINTPAAVPATSPTEVAAPLAPHVTEVPIAPAPVEAPVSTPEPVETPAVEPENPEIIPEAKKTETLLGGEKKPEEVKQDEKPVEIKTEEKAPEIVIPTYEPFTLPEGVTVDDAKMGDFTKMLGDFETTAKVPHEEVQKLGQQMVERHIDEMKRYTESLTQAWDKQKNDWKESFLKSSEFANRTDTVVNAAIDAIGLYGGTKEQQTEFRKLMEDTGIGNHPAMIRTLSNIMLAKPEPKQLAAPQIATAAKVSKVQKMYGKKS